MNDPAVTAPSAPIESQDAAWVVVPTRLDGQAVRALCADVERVFRINPHLEFKAWRQLAPDRFQAQWRNLSNEQEVNATLTVEHAHDGWLVSYSDGLKKSTRLRLEPDGHGSKVTLIDDYERLSPVEREQRLAEVDKSLLGWGQGLGSYFKQYRRWSWLAPWRWYMNRFWIRMKPSARRISWLIFVITLAEFLFFVFVALIWWIEQQR